MLFKNYSKAILVCIIGIISTTLSSKCIEDLEYTIYQNTFSHRPYKEKPDTWDLDIMILNAQRNPNTANYLDVLMEIAIQQTPLPTTTSTQKIDTTDNFLVAPFNKENNSTEIETLTETNTFTAELIVAESGATLTPSKQSLKIRKKYHRYDQGIINESYLVTFGSRKRNAPKRLILCKNGKSYLTSTDFEGFDTTRKATVINQNQNKPAQETIQTNYLNWIKPSDYERKSSTRKKRKTGILSPCTQSTTKIAPI